ncbi:MAG: YraN family protein [Gammaproteobacteria bacterium]|nr:YraN family protein [Gammaproteobacteria bacterium]
MSSRETGGRAEQYALDYLKSHGLKLVTRNFLCRMGEIDLIMMHNQHLVFVEVRYRKNSRYGPPAATISRTKQSRLTRTANFYLQQHGLDKPCRFDVVAIVAQPEVKIEWIQNAFDAA